MFSVIGKLNKQNSSLAITFVLEYAISKSDSSIITKFADSVGIYVDLPVKKFFSLVVINFKNYLCGRDFESILH